MKLFIGGYAQGKNKYAQARFPGYAFLDEKNYEIGVGIMNGEVGSIEKDSPRKRDDIEMTAITSMEPVIADGVTMESTFVKQDSGNAATEDTGETTTESEAAKAANQGILVNHLHRIIRQELESGRTEDEIREEILTLGRQPFEVVFLCDELGNGIVPIDPDERQWREVVGHILRAIADEANEVLRIFCGIPEVIKKESN